MILVIVITIASLIGSSYQASPKNEKTCKNVSPSDDFNVDWIDKVSEDGWDSPMASKLDPQPSSSQPPPENMTLKDSRCYDINVKSVVGEFPISYFCRFNNYNRQYCSLKTKGSALDRILRFYGEMILTKTDGKTYILSYMCLGGKSDYWAVLVPRGHRLDPETEKEVRQHLGSLNLSTDPKDMRSDHDLVSHKSIKKTGCNPPPDFNSAIQGKYKSEFPMTNLNEDNSVFNGFLG